MLVVCTGCFFTLDYTLSCTTTSQQSSEHMPKKITFSSSQNSACGPECLLHGIRVQFGLIKPSICCFSAILPLHRYNDSDGVMKFTFEIKLLFDQEQSEILARMTKCALKMIAVIHFAKIIFPWIATAQSFLSNKKKKTTARRWADSISFRNSSRQFLCFFLYLGSIPFECFM